VKVFKGKTKDVLIRVREFIYPVDFIILENQPVSNPRSQTPVILECPFLVTANAIINYRNGSMRLTFRDMTKEVNIFNLENQPRKIRDQTFEVYFVENNCDEESEGLENETLFLDKLFKNECDYINEKTYVGEPNFRVPFKKKEI